MTKITFDAAEYHADQRFVSARYAFEGSEERGWNVLRDGSRHLSLGPGYRLLKTQVCGVCSTDLARHHLPFPLPQVTGHELVATDDRGTRYVVEINASHRALGVDHDCPFCRLGLATHCPERLVLGIHDLPGGFGPWILAPKNALHAVPENLDSETAALIEPFAAALHAVGTIAPKAGERIAVLGPRRLGLLVIAALAAWRRSNGTRFEILALGRHPELLQLARELGATGVEEVRGSGENLADELADVVVDTTGHPSGLELAVRLAGREVHLKSTHGAPACGLQHLTELVVDEQGIARFGLQPPGTPESCERPAPRIAWLSHAAPPRWLVGRADIFLGNDASELLGKIRSKTTPAQLPRADVAVVSSPAQVDAAVRPRAGEESSLVRPRGLVCLDPRMEATDSPLLDAILARGLRLTSSRCGDFAEALALLATSPELRNLGRRFVTHRFSGKNSADSAEQLERAFGIARTQACIKALILAPESDATRGAEEPY